MPTSPSASPAKPAFRPAVAILLKMGSITSAALLSVMVKLATDHGAHSLEIVFYRYAFAMPLVMAWVMHRGGIKAVHTNVPGSHIIRATLGMSAMLCVFMTVGALPLAEATTILFTAPLIATALSTVILRESVGIHRWLAIGVGIVGTLIVIQPGGSHQEISTGGIALGLLAASLTAMSTITIRQLGATQTATVMIFYFTLIGAVVTGLAMPFFFQQHDPMTWLLFVCCAVLGTSGQACGTSALRYASVSLLAPFEYSSLLWTAFFGWLIWADLPSIHTIIGATLIGCAGLYTFYREHLRRGPPIAESTSIVP